VALGDYWHAVPLILAISLVYAATRREAMDQILRKFVHVGVWIGGFMIVAFVVLQWFSMRL
jgi:hypothetical protein